MDENDTTTMIRVHRETVQRVSCTASSLNSMASFVIVVPLRQIVLVYHGSDSSTEDTEVANEIGKEYKSEEICRKIASRGKKIEPVHAGHNQRNEVLCLREGSPNMPGDILSVLFEIFWLTPEEYRFRCKLISSALKNVNKTLHIIERGENMGKFRLRKLSTSVPDKNGTVALLPFPIYHPKKIALLIVGEQYDLWFGESVSRDAIQYARQLVMGLIGAAAPLGENITRREKGLFEGVHYESPLRVQMQGYEDPGFRSHFNMDFPLRPERNPYVYLREHGAELLCGEASCVDMFSWVGWIVPNASDKPPPAVGDPLFSPERPTHYRGNGAGPPHTPY